MAYIDRNRTRERGISGVAAIAVVAAVGFAVVNGLAVNVWRAADRPFIVQEWRDETHPPPPVTPPPPKVSARGSTTATVSIPTIVERPTIPTIALPPAPPTGTTDGMASDAVIVAVLRIVPPVDRSARAAPRGDPAQWVREEDYPAAALRSGEQGRTGFRLDIGDDGRATACAVTASSGSAELDAAACRVLMRRARFSPGRNTAGEPSPSSYASSVEWRLPRD